MSTLHDFLNHPIEALERALHIRKQIDQLNEALKELFGPTPISLAAVNIMQPKPRGRRKMSAEARARIAAAQRARWAKQKGTHGPETAIVLEREKTKKKGGMSAAGRASVAAAQKARWAKVKAQISAPAKAAPLAKKKKRGISAAHRAKLVASAKARWAKVKK